MFIIGELVDGHKLDGGNAQVEQVVDDAALAKSGVCAAEPLRDVLAQNGQAPSRGPRR